MLVVADFWWGAEKGLKDKSAATDGFNNSEVLTHRTGR
jgi:hypothetical protein